MGRDAKGRHFGHLQLVNCYGLKLVVSPDVFMWIIPTGITLALFIGALSVAYREPLVRWSPGPPKHYPKSRHFDREVSWIGVADLAVTLMIVLAALVFSLLCGLTDPGAIPRNDNSYNHEGNEDNDNNNNTNENSALIESKLRREDLANQAVAANNAHMTATIQVEPADDEHSGLPEHIRLLRLNSKTQSSSLLGTLDPYSEMSHWVFCRVCNIRRPPRAAHCYQCGICTLHSDHHCGVVGGDVSLRSIRWFVLYLQCIGVAALNTLTWILGSLFDNKNRANPGSMALHISLLVFVGNIVLMVGGLACFYTWMVVSDLTRRESQGKAGGGKGGGKYICYYHEGMNPKWKDYAERWYGNILRVLYPPPSLIAWEE